jgi:tRNA-dihydrouridine synthase
MATLSHEALRVLIHRWGDPDEYFSEMIHAPAFLAGGRFEHWYVRTAPCPERMVWQLTGNTAEPMAKAAKMLIPYGGIGIDLNMGCSAPDIAKTGAGIAWMSKPLPEVARLVSGVRHAIDTGGNAQFRLSVKLRLGEDENYERLIDFCRMLIDEGAELLTLHPRVRRGTYSRPAKREIVARLASDVGVPVYGNGDVSSPEDALDFIARYPCSGLMIGRSAVQKPWIFGGIRQLEKARVAAERQSESERSLSMHPAFCEPDSSVPTDNAPADTTPTGNMPADSSPTGGKPVIRSRFPETIDHLEVAQAFLEHLAICQPPEFQLTRAHRFFFYYCDNFSFAHHIKMRMQNAKTIDAMLPLLTEYFASMPGDQYLLK